MHREYKDYWTIYSFHSLFYSMINEKMSEVIIIEIIYLNIFIPTILYKLWVAAHSAAFLSLQ